MQNVELNEAQAESRLPGQVSITSDMQMIPALWQKMKRKFFLNFIKSLLMKVKEGKKKKKESERGEWKSWLKTQH